MLGTTLSAGDFHGYRKADLDAGAPDEDVGSIADAGGVTAFYGSGTTVAGLSAQVFVSQNLAGVEASSESGDRMGAALAAGDYNRDGKADLMVGVPTEDVGSLSDAGGASPVYGSGSGLVGLSSQVFLGQDTLNVPDDAESGDRFGFSV